MSHNPVEFFNQLADPNFAQNFNLVGENGRLYTEKRGCGGSLFGNRAAERTVEIRTAAKMLADLTTLPDVFKGINSEQLTQISGSLIALKDRMLKRTDTSDKEDVFTNMATAIQKVEGAKRKSVFDTNVAKLKSFLPTTSTVLTCGAVVLYTAAVLTGYIRPVTI